MDILFYGILTLTLVVGVSYLVVKVSVWFYREYRRQKELREVEETRATVTKGAGRKDRRG